MTFSPFTVVHAAQPRREQRAAASKARAASLLPLTIAEVFDRSGVPPKPRLAKTVGLWDMGSMLGDLAPLIEAFNRVQSRFVFVQVFAVVPTWLLGGSDRIRSWAASQGIDSRDVDFAELDNNVVANDFFEKGREVRTDIGLDYLVGIIPQMVAGSDSENGGELYWNHISSNSQDCRLILVSTRDFPDFAARFCIPYEVLTFWAILAQLFQAVHPQLGLFHKYDHVCLFDFNINRWTIGQACHAGEIHPECLQRLKPRFRPVATALLQALKDYWSSAKCPA